MVLICWLVSRHHSDWTDIPSCATGLGQSPGRYFSARTRGHRKGASDFHKVSAAPPAPACGSVARPTKSASKTYLTTRQQGFASQIFYILTLWTTKSSILLLYMRLSPSGGHRIASWTMLVASALWALIAIVLICIPCNPAQFYTSRAGECGEMVCIYSAVRS